MSMYLSAVELPAPGPPYLFCGRHEKRAPLWDRATIGALPFSPAPPSASTRYATRSKELPPKTSCFLLSRFRSHLLPFSVVCF